jgi:HK97 family phage portal protein
MNSVTDVKKTASIRGLDDSFAPTYGNGTERTLFTKSRGTNILTLYEVVKQSPEVMGSINAIVEDVMSDGWKYIGSKSAISKAEKFALQSRFYKILTNAIFELITTGNAYILKLSLNDENIKSLTTRITSKNPELIKELALGKIKASAVYELIDSEFSIPKDLQVLKSSTIKISYDETGKVASFIQEVRGAKRVFRPQDIIHLSLINVGGEPYGFSPLEPLLSDLATLIFAKNFAGKFFENDGLPSFLINMPEDFPDSPNYKKLKQELKELQNKANKFRGLLTTGKTEVQVIEKFQKDMAYSELIKHFTQIVLIAIGVPAYRINWQSDKQAGTQVNRAMEGYYKKLAFLQKLIEESLNVDLFEVFNVELKFNAVYKVDMMRQAQIVQILTQANAITIEEARDMMKMDPQIPAGTMPTPVGDQSAINMDKDEAENDQGQANNPKPADEKQDNKTKDFTEEIIAIRKLHEDKAEKVISEATEMKKQVAVKEDSLAVKSAEIITREAELGALANSIASRQNEVEKYMAEMKANMEKNVVEQMNRFSTEKESLVKLSEEIKAQKDIILSEKETIQKEMQVKMKEVEMERKSLDVMKEEMTGILGAVSSGGESKVPDYVDVKSFMTFKIIVERFTGQDNFNKAKILYQIKGKDLILYFSDGIWKYRLVLNKSKLDMKRFMAEQLPFAINID